MTTTFTRARRSSDRPASLADTLIVEARHGGVVMQEHREAHVIILGPGGSAPVGVVPTLDVADAPAEIERQEG